LTSPFGCIEVERLVPKPLFGAEKKKTRIFKPTAL